MVCDFETKRLLLRSWSADDAEFLLRISNDEEVIRFTGDKKFSSVEEARSFILHSSGSYKCGFGRWIAESKKTGESIGWCGLNDQIKELGIIDVSFRFLKEHWGLGYATETGRAVVQYGFEVAGMDKITGRVAIGNSASEGVLKKLGMQFEKLSTCHHHAANWYGLTKQAWLQMSK